MDSQEEITDDEAQNDIPQPYLTISKIDDPEYELTFAIDRHDGWIEMPPYRIRLQLPLHMRIR